MDDKELDDFFRKQSEHPDIPYREEDWEKLRKKLDASTKNNGAKPGNKGWWIGLLLLTMISGIGWGWKYWEEKKTGCHRKRNRRFAKFSLERRRKIEGRYARNH